MHAIAAKAAATAAETQAAARAAEAAEAAEAAADEKETLVQHLVEAAKAAAKEAKTSAEAAKAAAETAKETLVQDLKKAEKIAKSKGYVVVIGHLQNWTIDALEEWHSEVNKKGLIFDLFSFDWKLSNNTSTNYFCTYKKY